MVRTRYIGSNRPRDAGFSATHKQDFVAHVTGGDWIHSASNITVTGVWGNVQSELDAIISEISALDYMVINTGVPLPDINARYNIPLFSDSGGLEIRPTLTKMDGWGDIILPTNTTWNEIRVQEVDIPGKGQDLLIMGQDNITGLGGELHLRGGYSAANDVYSNIVPYGNIVFEVGQTPVITQRDGAQDLPGNDFSLRAQNNHSSTSTPANLWLESGSNSLGQAGNINIDTYPGYVNLISAGLFFDGYTIATIGQHQMGVAGNANTLSIHAQNALNGAGGNLLLAAGIGSDTVTYGSITLNAANNLVSVISNGFVFDAFASNPSIHQDIIDAPNAYTLSIAAQDNASGNPGNLILESGFSNTLGTSGSIQLWADDGGVILRTSQLLFKEDYNNPYIGQMDVDVAGPANDLIIEAQSNVSGKGGSLYLYSAHGNTGGTRVAGDDGYVNIDAGFGQVNISGTPLNTRGGINLHGTVFIAEGAPVDNPVDGVYLFVRFGNLYWRDASGTDYSLLPP